MFYRPSPHLATSIKLEKGSSVYFSWISQHACNRKRWNQRPATSTDNIYRRTRGSWISWSSLLRPQGRTDYSFRSMEAMETCFSFVCGIKRRNESSAKVALLLHSGGMELQEIYYTFAPEDEAQNNFDNCLTVLDNYFTPKVNVPFWETRFPTNGTIRRWNNRSICVPPTAKSCQKASACIHNRLFQKTCLNNNCQLFLAGS